MLVLPVFMDKLGTKETLQTTVVVLLLCVVPCVVSLLPEVLLWTEGLFVNSSGVSQLGEICRGWGFSVLFLWQKHLNMSFKCSVVLGFLQLLDDFFFFFLLLSLHSLFAGVFSDSL